MPDVTEALKAIKAKGAPFISRGDRSGTHAAELELWKAAGIDIGRDKGPWYKEIGQGMGAALNTASAANAYLLADRGTWLSFKNRGDLDILLAGDRRMFNQYGVMLVSPEKHPHVKKDLGQAFVDWLVSPDGQKAIADYKINGEQLFFPMPRCRGHDAAPAVNRRHSACHDHVRCSIRPGSPARRRQPSQRHHRGGSRICGRIRPKG
jgi:tungstate transport system substrate-binding protein